MTQDLPFAEAEKILEKHLDICSFVHHKPNNQILSAFDTSVKFPTSTGSRGVFFPNFSPNIFNLLDQLQIHNISFPGNLTSLWRGSNDLQSFYVYLYIDELPAKVSGANVYQALANAGCPGYISTVDDEAGKYDGAVVIKLDNEEDKTYVLNYDYKKLFDVDVEAEEVDEAAFFKFATKFERDESGNNVFIRLKGMEWTTSEDQVRNFLKDCVIDELIMTKTPTGRPTGEAFIKMKTEDDSIRAKALDNERLGSRFVVVDEIFEEQFNKANCPTAVEPKPGIYRNGSTRERINKRFKQ